MKAIVSEVTEFSIPFYDLDPLGICWHGNYVKYFEDARCALFRKIDYDYKRMLESGYYWPVIDLNIRYVNALRYEQKVIIEVGLVEYENYMKIKYLLKDRDSGDKITKGSTTQVAVNKDTHEMSLVSPDILQEKLGKYL